MSIYDRTANDASESLFNSIYGDLFALAENEQTRIYAGCKSKARNGRAPADYRVGENAEMLSGFCSGKVSIGAALDAIRVAKAYAQ